jgi:hypothetical protein
MEMEDFFLGFSNGTTVKTWIWGWRIRWNILGNIWEWSWIRSLIGRRILKIGCAKPALHIGSVVVLWKRLGDYHRRWWPIHFRGEAHSSLLCFAGVLEKSGAQKCSEKALSLAADDVFGNGSLCEGRASAGNVRESYAKGSHATCIWACSEYYIWRRALATKQYPYAIIAGP